MKEKSWWERLVHTHPSEFQFSAAPTYPFTLIRDLSDKYPAFERSLYCHLDYDMLIMIICWVNLLDQLTQNPMLAVCISYFIERGFRWLRGYLGEKNIAKKTITDDCFLL